MDVVKTTGPNSAEITDADYTYNKAGNVTNLQFAGTAGSVTYGYGVDRGWLESVVHSGGKFSESLLYNDNGNISEQSITNPTAGSNYNYVFTFDNRNRLTNAVSSNTAFSESYSYDNDGSIMSKNRSGKNMSHVYHDNNHRLKEVIINSDTVHYAFDVKGNLYGGYGVLKEYNFRNQPTEMMNADSIVYNYLYNSQGERIKKENMAEHSGEYYLRDYLGRDLVIYDIETGFIKEANIIGIDKVGKIEVENDIDNRYYYLKDHLGSIRTVLNSSGNVYSAMDYFPYGELIREYNPQRQREQFTGKERDAESGYDFFSWRTYPQDLGLLLQVDLLSDLYAGWSPYSYAGSNPINNIDPTGMAWYHVTEEYEDTEEYKDEDGDTKWRTVKKTRQVWRWFEEEEKEIWQGGYNSDGTKKMVLTTGLSDGFLVDWLTQFGMGIDAFYDQYNTMITENVVGNDHYHHAMANSNAALSGPGGKAAAKIINFLREVTDMLRKGDTFGDTWQDQKANVHGRNILPGNSPESHNVLFDVRRGGSRATVNRTNLSNQTLYDVLLKAVIIMNTH